MDRRSSTALAFYLALLAGGLAPGDGAAGQSPSEVLRREVERLGDSARVRLLAPGLVVSDGIFLGFSNDSLRVSEADALIVVGLDELEGLSVRSSRWLSTGLTTATIGLLVGGAAGFFVGSKECGLDLVGCDARAGRKALRWGLVFGSAGGVLGGLLGSRILRWKDVFP